MKRIFTLMLAALIGLSAAALAEADGYWTTNEDWYYHLSEYCGGAESMVPISRDGAEKFEKHSCPNCVPGEFDGEVRAMIADIGVVVVRIPDSCLSDQWFDEVVSYTDDASYEGIEAYRALGDYLSGEEYVRFLSDEHAQAGAQALARRPRLWTMNNERIMSSRHLNGAWYFAVRPGAILRDSFSMDSWPMYWRTDAYQLRMQNGILICDYITGTQTEKLDLKLETPESEEIFQLHTGEWFNNDLRIIVLRLGDEYVAEIFQTVDGSVPEAELIIGGRSGIPLSSHTNGDQDIYCCVLTEAELDALRGGAEAELRARSAEQEPQYFGTPYAILYSEDAGFAIIDREGNRAVEFGAYEGIFREGADGSFRCVDESGAFIYLDGTTLEPLEKEGEEK